MRFVSFIPLLLLPACSLAPDAIIPAARVPQQWQESAALGSMQSIASGDAYYGDKELERLTAQALAHNTDLAAALTRIAQARANATIRGAGQYPQLDTSGGASQNHSRRDGQSSTSTAWNSGVNLSYELDIWAKNSNAAASADWALKASEFDHAAIRLMVIAEVARLYTGLLAYDARIIVAQTNLTNAQDILRITMLRYQEGAVSGLEEAQQRTALANNQASLASLRNQRALYQHELAQMAGAAPANLSIAEGGTIESLALPALTLDDPWSILSRRPDIAAAEANLRAAHIEIGIARANALPGLSLGLGATISGDPVTTATSLAASFLAPIFRGGALQADIERSEAARDETQINYEAALLTAIREVEDALSGLQSANERAIHYAEAVEQARRAYQIARARFEAGSIDFTTLLDTQASMLQAEDNQVGAKQEQLASHIALRRAMGEP